MFSILVLSCSDSQRGRSFGTWSVKTKSSLLIRYPLICLEYQHQTAARLPTLRPTAWLPRAKISTVDFSFTKPGDWNTARVQPVKAKYQKYCPEWEEWHPVTSHEVSDSRQLGLSGAREGGPSTKSMWHGSKEVSGVGRCQQEPTKEPSKERIKTFRHNFTNSHSLQWYMKTCFVKELWKTSKRIEDSRRQVQWDTGRLRERDEPLCCLVGLTVQCIQDIPLSLGKRAREHDSTWPEIFNYKSLPLGRLVSGRPCGERETRRYTQHVEIRMMRHDENTTRNRRSSATSTQILFKWWFLPALPALRIGSDSRVLIDISTCSWGNYTHSPQGSFTWCVSWKAGQIPPPMSHNVTDEIIHR